MSTQYVKISGRACTFRVPGEVAQCNSDMAEFVDLDPAMCTQLCDNDPACQFVNYSEIKGTKFCVAMKTDDQPGHKLTCPVHPHTDLYIKVNPMAPMVLSSLVHSLVALE